MNVEQLIKTQEGYSRFPYDDGYGNLTVGWGRNLSATPLYGAEARLMLEHDLVAARNVCAVAFPRFVDLSPVRQAALLSMAYNLGHGRFFTFKKMIKALHELRYLDASAEMLDSKWAHQVGNRAIVLAEMMESNEWPEPKELSP